MGSTVSRILGCNSVNKEPELHKETVSKEETKQQQKVCHLKLAFIFCIL